MGGSGALKHLSHPLWVLRLANCVTLNRNMRVRITSQPLSLRLKLDFCTASIGDLKKNPIPTQLASLKVHDHGRTGGRHPM